MEAGRSQDLVLSEESEVEVTKMNWWWQRQGAPLPRPRQNWRCPGDALKNSRASYWDTGSGTQDWKARTPVLGQPSPRATWVSGTLSRHVDLVREGDCSYIFSKRGGTSPVLQGSNSHVPKRVSNPAAVCAICTGFHTLIFIIPSSTSRFRFPSPLTSALGNLGFCLIGWPKH